MTEMPLSDANLDLELLKQLRGGNRTALTALYARHQAPLYRFAILRSGSTSIAADVVQDIFVALIEDRFNFDPMRGALSSFLFGVARNFILKREEAERRFLPLEFLQDDGDDAHEMEFADTRLLPLEKILADDRAETLRHALAKIAPHYRDVLILYEMQDLTYVEIANICDIDIGTVRSRLSRARAKLISLLKTKGITNVEQPPSQSSREKNL
jgi:RNA polymerase sigma-70 factor, ECF subfamily